MNLIRPRLIYLYWILNQKQHLSQHSFFLKDCLCSFSTKIQSSHCSLPERHWRQCLRFIRCFTKPWFYLLPHSNMLLTYKCLINCTTCISLQETMPSVKEENRNKKILQLESDTATEKQFCRLCKLSLCLSW